jgi:hypothetical protein
LRRLGCAIGDSAEQLVPRPAFEVVAMLGRDGLREQGGADR